MQPPDSFHTERLVVRRWRLQDAPSLKAALDGSVAHLQPWIPWEIAEPAPLPAIEARLAKFAASFDSGREWLYGIFLHDAAEVLGGIGLYPRGESGRVHVDEANRVEMGYWLRADVTGRGYATEAARAVLAAAVSLPGMKVVEIRCDPRNIPSAAVPQRLGFRHARTFGHDPDSPGVCAADTMIWEHDTAPPPPAAGRTSPGTV